MRLKLFQRLLNEYTSGTENPELRIRIDNKEYPINDVIEYQTGNVAIVCYTKERTSQ